jgi:ribosomal protein L15
MIEPSTKALWALIENTLAELLQEGGAASMQAVDLAQALDASKALGGVTNRLVQVHARIITARALAKIEAIEEGRVPPQSLNHRQNFQN